jgi:citrate synthase
MNQRDAFVNQRVDVADVASALVPSYSLFGVGGLPGMTDWLSAEQAAAVLGVKKATLYAYASRGLLRTTVLVPNTRLRAYRRDDVELLRARSHARAGHAAVAASALRWGDAVLETRIGTVRADGPVYRNRAALDLVGEGASFETVCNLLWGAKETGVIDRAFGLNVGALASLLGRNAEPIDAMLVTAAALAGSPRTESLEHSRRRAPRLVRQLIAACAIPRGADAVAAP